MIPYKGVVFDCDGVLFDSHPANLAYYNSVLSELGEALITPADTQHAQLCHTACSRDVFKVLLGDERVPEALEMAAARDYRDFLPYLEPYGDMLEVLPKLAEHYPLGLATNRTNSVYVLLEHFGVRDCFHTVVTSSDVENPKPSPDMLHLAADQMGIHEGDMVFVGDAVSDHIAAQKAGLDFIAFGDGIDHVPKVSGWEEFKGWLPPVSPAS
jgi:HAD superfamily hydrolase (TIGR01549 family)